MVTSLVDNVMDVALLRITDLDNPAVPDRDALMDKAQIALGWARVHGVKVVFVRVAFVPDDYDAIPHRHKAFGAAKQNRRFADGIRPLTSIPPWRA
jgi:nicotinamidase-related amidase